MYALIHGIHIFCLYNAAQSFDGRKGSQMHKHTLNVYFVPLYSD